MPNIDFNLYLVTDRKETGARDLLWVLREALEGGLRAIQLREKDLESRDLLNLAQEVKQLCDEYQAELFINDRADVAMALNCHVHLTANSIPTETVRSMMGPDAKLGVSTHQLAEAQLAAKSGADFILFGPVYSTPSKIAYGAPQGVDTFEEIASNVPLPVFGIGGIKLEQIPALRAHGAERVALISAILQSPDPRSATRDILDALAE